MKSISIEDAQARLPELIGSLAAGEELVITANGEPVAALTLRSREPEARELQPRKAGFARDMILWIAPDFDDPLDGF